MIYSAVIRRVSSTTIWCSRSVPTSCTCCKDNFTRSEERKSLPWAGPAATISGMVFSSLMIRAMNESFGSSTPRALSIESTTDSGVMRNCTAKMNNKPQKKLGKIGCDTTSSPTVAPAAFRTHSAAGCSSEMPRQTFSMRFGNAADSNTSPSDTTTKPS